ncbi:MAG TPA: pyridoxal-dependent decarboxylase [Thermomicrobiales bacterium]|nr:pyridoxal-dependent decarboxylase [Thermomicrobiales bacterium]
MVTLLEAPPRVAERPRLPEYGRSAGEVAALLDEAARADVRWRDGRVAGFLFLGGEDVARVAREAYLRFFMENGLSGVAFPSLKKFEEEVAGMAAALLHGDAAVGTITGGGTESILLAVKTARDRARALRPAVTRPTIVMPRTAHPAFDKAAHYFGLTPVRTPVGADYRVDLAAYRAAITDDTVLLVGSAPNYPYGMVDPIPAMAALAADRAISFHVDACVGGFFLPFAEQLGARLPAWDFRVPGVTSISADLHKFGYTAKGASLLLSRDADVFRYQGFEFDNWPCGRYRTPNTTGTRPGGAIAAAWAVLNYLGVDGYRRLVGRTLTFTRRLVAGIAAIPGLTLYGEPDMSVLAYGSPTLDITAIGERLERRGWFLHWTWEPPAVHLMLSPGHEAIVGDYLADLAAATAEVAGRRLAGAERERVYN